MTAQDAPGGAKGRSEAAVFGRQPELATAEAFLDAAGERFGVMVLEGEAGIGKTTVWRDVARRAGERGFRVLAARPAEAETKLALSAVADLLELVPSAAFAELPGPQRRALDIALLRVAPAAAPLDPRTVATAVRTLLAALSAERPLLVAIDDVQWLDGASAAVLEFALRRLAGRRLGWLLACRLDEPARLIVDGTLPPESLTRATLGPLTPLAVHHLLGDRLERPVPRAALARIHEASGGNPFYALEIARELNGGGAIDTGARLPVPQGMRERLAARISTLAPSAREALLAAAALSHPSAELVVRASSASGLAAAEETGLLRVDGGRVAFAHPLYASAVYTVAATMRRSRMHRRLARLAADPEERARHLAVATSEPDETTARILEDGGALARTRGAWASAAELLEHARALTPHDRPDDAARRAIVAAEHHVHAGDGARARELLAEILAQPPARALRADALRLLAEISSGDEDFAEAARLFTEALAYADDPRVAGAIELGFSYVHASLMDFDSGRALAHRALERAERVGDRSLASQALAHRAMMDFLGARGAPWDAVERSLELEPCDTLVPLLRRPGTLAGLLLLYVGRHAEARERLTQLCAAARERGDESDLPVVLFWLSWLETRSGDLVSAAALAEEAASLATLTGSHSMRARALTQQALVHAHLGAIADTRRCCAEASAPVRPPGNVLPGVWIAASLGLLELSLGNHGAAWEAYEPLASALETHGIGEPVLAFFLPDAIETIIALGRLDRAGALLDAFEARARELDRGWALATAARCRGLLLAGRGDLAGAAAALGRALVEHERLDMPFERARTLLVSGVIERRTRKRTRAKQSFELALEIFDRLGARLWAARARRELGRLGLRRGSRDELTGSERRVAVLAASGLTNREVAAALFISPKTVGANLTRIYRKLDIASRAELGGRMADSVQE